MWRPQKPAKMPMAMRAKDVQMEILEAPESGQGDLTKSHNIFSGASKSESTLAGSVLGFGNLAV